MTQADETAPSLPGSGSAGKASRPSPRPPKRPSSPKGGKRRKSGRTRLSVSAWIGFSFALLTLVADQASKLYTLFVFDLPVREPVALNPFTNLIVVWNRGISYGLFQQHDSLGRWVLIVVSLLAAIGLSVWIFRARGHLLAASLGLIVGGALGNVVDRLAYGAVFDFIQLRIGDWSWYVFNVADAAIVAGVVGLLYDSFVLEGRRKA